MLRTGVNWSGNLYLVKETKEEEKGGFVILSCILMNASRKKKVMLTQLDSHLLYMYVYLDH